jgi:hypothetical protein
MIGLHNFFRNVYYIFRVRNSTVLFTEKSTQVLKEIIAIFWLCKFT